MECIKKYYRVDRKKISFLKFIIEAYDGVAVISTVDNHLGTVLLRISPGSLEDVEMILEDLKKNMRIEHLGLGK